MSCTSWCWSAAASPTCFASLADQEESFTPTPATSCSTSSPSSTRSPSKSSMCFSSCASETNTLGPTGVDPAASRRQKAMSTLPSAHMRRGAENSLRWMSTLFPTHAYAMEAEMGLDA